MNEGQMFGKAFEERFYNYMYHTYTAKGICKIWKSEGDRVKNSYARTTKLLSDFHGLTLAYENKYLNKARSIYVELKSCENKFNSDNLKPHQRKDLRQLNVFGAYAFLLIEIRSENKVYKLDSNDIEAMFLLRKTWTSKTLEKHCRKIYRADSLHILDLPRDLKLLPIQKAQLDCIKSYN